MIVESSRDYIAIGRLAHTHRVLVRDIEAAAEELKLTPALRVNGVIYFNARQATAIKQKLARGE